MDLLRLVLVQQPLDKLLKLPKLGNNFWRLRSEILLHDDTPRKNYPSYFMWLGELSSLTREGIKQKWLLSRAVFVGNGSAYVCYANMESPRSPSRSPVSLEEALASGIPEIQAAALAKGWTEVRNYDYSQISWTPQLEKAVLKYGGTIRPLPTEFPCFKKEQYLKSKDVRGIVLHFLRGREEVREIPELSQILNSMTDRDNPYYYSSSLVERGYLYPILMLGCELQQSLTIKSTAAAYARAPILQMMRNVHMSQEETRSFFNAIQNTSVTRNLRNRVEAIYSDTNLFQALELDIQIYYLIILGYQIPILTDNGFYIRILAKVGYPVSGAEHLLSGPIGVIPTNIDDICYDPAGWASLLKSQQYGGDMSSAIEMYERKAYALGQLPYPEEEALSRQYAFPASREIPKYGEILSAIIGD